MAAKKVSKSQSKNNTKKKEDKHVKPASELPPLTPEFKKKYDDNKKNLDKFISQCVDKFDKYITSVSILPPLPPAPNIPGIAPAPIPSPNEIPLFILIDDGDVKQMSRSELIVKMTDITNKFAKDLDPNFKPQVMLISELKDACYDSKADVIKTVATSGILYDKGLLQALKLTQVHKDMILQKFEKYVVSYIAAGSFFRGDSNPADIDVFIVIDDTDVKKMSRLELRDRLRGIIYQYGHEASRITGVKGEFHIQNYILTDFWDWVKEANPVIFTVLRDGVPIYDRGVFMPWKLLLQMGRIKPSPEAIDMNMEVGDKLLDSTKQKLLNVVGQDLFYAVMNPTQAALMLYGVPPPTPREAVKLMEEIYVKKEKMLEQKYVDILENIRKTFKEIEHKTLTEVSGKDVDNLIKDCRDYLDRIKKLFATIQERNEKETIAEIHSTSLNLTKDLLQELGVKNISVVKTPELFKKHICEEEKVPIKYYKSLQNIIQARKDFLAKKLTKQEINKVRREANDYIRLILEMLDSRRASILNKSKVHFKNDKVYGELLILDQVAFLTSDITKREEIMMGTISKDGILINLKKTKLAEYEKYIKAAKLPKERLIKPHFFEALKELIGEGVEIIWKQ